MKGPISSFRRRRISSSASSTGRDAESFWNSRFVDWLPSGTQVLLIALLLWELSHMRSGIEEDRLARQQERAYDLVMKGFDDDFVGARQNLLIKSDEYAGSLLNALQLLSVRHQDLNEYRKLSGDAHRVLTYLEVVATCFRSGACDTRLKPIARESFGDSARLLCPVILEMRQQDGSDPLARSYHRDFEWFFGACGSDEGTTGATL